VSLRFLVSVLASACLLLAAACSGGGDGESPTAAPRPTSVPSAAKLVSKDQAFGSASVPAGKDRADSELFSSTNCADDILTITTNHHAVYAELPCDRALPADVSARFIDKPVQVRMVVSEPAKLYVDSSEAGSAEFTVGRIWLEE